MDCVKGQLKEGADFGFKKSNNADHGSGATKETAGGGKRKKGGGITPNGHTNCGNVDRLLTSVGEGGKNKMKMQVLTGRKSLRVGKNPQKHGERIKKGEGEWSDRIIGIRGNWGTAI